MTVRTFKPRRGRLRPAQREALAVSDALLVDASSVAERIAGWAGPVILEIGFGTGAATIALAQADPTRLVIAIDVHTPGVGELLRHAREAGLGNLVVVEGDALSVLSEQIAPQSLNGIISWFPDPWPKARHHKRRLVTPERIALLASRTRQGGWWQLATDWAEYAQQAIETISASGQWVGGVAQRPSWRPVTRYERRGLAAGRVITDLHFTRC